MSPVVVDTDVISLIFKSHPLAAPYERELKDRTLLVSFMTLAELDQWQLHAKWGEIRKQRLAAWLDIFVAVPSDRHLCRLWASITDNARTRGLPQLLCRTESRW